MIPFEALKVDKQAVLWKPADGTSPIPVALKRLLKSTESMNSSPIFIELPMAHIGEEHAHRMKLHCRSGILSSAPSSDGHLFFRKVVVQVWWSTKSTWSKLLRVPLLTPRSAAATVTPHCHPNDQDNVRWYTNGTSNKQTVHYLQERCVDGVQLRVY